LSGVHGKLGAGRLWLTRNLLALGNGGDLLVVLGDFQHLLLRHWIVELVGNAARLIRSAPPVRRVIQKMLEHMASTTATKLQFQHRLMQCGGG
jgi:hypothetical protein